MGVEWAPTIATCATGVPPGRKQMVARRETRLILFPLLPEEMGDMYESDEMDGAEEMEAREENDEMEEMEDRY